MAATKPQRRVGWPTALVIGVVAALLIVDRGAHRPATPAKAAIQAGAVAVPHRVNGQHRYEPTGPFPVRSITDGDTLTLVDGRVVRLAQVDAPETYQCFGSQSTAALTALVKGKSVMLRRPSDGPEREKYGRTLAEVIVGGKSVDEALVRQGAAEWYDQFANEDADIARRLRAAEAEARSAGRGLWSACSA